MKRLLKEIKSNDGVVGSVVLCREKKEFVGDLPAAFLPEKLHDFSEYIRRLAVLGDDDGGFRGMEFCYKHVMVVARRVNSDFLLMTFCLPDVDVQQIHLQHSVLIPEFLDKLHTFSVLPIHEKESLTTTKQGAGGKKRTLVFRGVSYNE